MPAEGRARAAERVHEARFRVMGSDAHLIVVGGTPALVDHARRRLGELEARWTRFRSESELSRLNAAAGRVVRLSPDTFALVEAAVAAWELTGGAFDPTVLPAVVAAGYDRDFDQLAALASAAAEGPPRRRPSALSEQPPSAQLPWEQPPTEKPPSSSSPMADVHLDPIVRCVTLPTGAALDPGGIGKGLAADLVSAELLAAGAAGACVSLGGDLRVRGEAPGGERWSIAVDDPFDREPVMVIGLDDGAVATTGRLRRRWWRDGVELHHVIDPARGRPADTAVVSATAVAGEGWWAEAAAKAVFLAGPAPARPGDGPARWPGVPGVLAAVVTADGAVTLDPAMAGLGSPSTGGKEEA